MQKLYCYVDGSGQDDTSKFFIVVAVVTHHDQDEVRRKLLEIEFDARTNGMKWHRTRHDWLEARKELESRYQDFDKKALFVGVKCGYARGKRMPVNYLSEIVRKWSNKAGLKIPLNPHAFRHKFGRDLAKKGANAFVISSLLGHAQVSSSYPYTMLFGKDRESMYRKFKGK